MYLLLENFKEFLALIETEEDKASVPIFIDKNQITTETGMMMGEIIIQYQYDTNMLAVFKTSEGIDPVMLPSTQFYNALEYYSNKEAVEKAREQSKQMVDKLNRALDMEYEKAVKVLKERGFETIIPYAWSE